LIILGVWGAKPPIEKKKIKKVSCQKSRENGTLMTQIVMIKYDFIIGVYLLNQRPLRSNCILMER
jgi:quinol-cytochrome oxidoreductase complex cytochrome b subunit